jgi:hypothetical protein
MTSATQTYMPSKDNGLRLFLHNSSLFITAKKMWAKKLALREPWAKMGDPRFRISYGDASKLQKLVQDYDDPHGSRGGACVDFGTYGSDMVKLQHLFEGEGSHLVNIPVRCTKEKQVKIQITADIQMLMSMCPEHDRKKNVIVLFAGDSDFIPVVEDAVSEGWRIEIWSPREALSKHFKPYWEIKDEDGCPLVRYVCMDEFIDSGMLGFMEYEVPEPSHEAKFVISIDTSADALIPTPSETRRLNDWARAQVCNYYVFTTGRHTSYTQTHMVYNVSVCLNRVRVSVYVHRT